MKKMQEKESSKLNEGEEDYRAPLSECDGTTKSQEKVKVSDSLEVINN